MYPRGLADMCDQFIHIIQHSFIGTGTIVWKRHLAANTCGIGVCKLDCVDPDYQIKR